MKTIKIKCHIQKKIEMIPCPFCGKMVEVKDHNPSIDFHDDILEVSLSHFCVECKNGWNEIFYYSTTYEYREIEQMI